MNELKELAKHIPEKERWVTLLYDEIKIREGLCYDERTGTELMFRWNFLCLFFFFVIAQAVNLCAPGTCGCNFKNCDIKHHYRS